MPADGSGQTAYCQPGGVVAAMGEAMEEQVLSVAREDIARVRSLAVDPEVTKAELISALLFLCHSALRVVDVSECRGERVAVCGADPGVPAESWKEGPCNLPAEHESSSHINDACHAWVS